MALPTFKKYNYKNPYGLSYSEADDFDKSQLVIPPLYINERYDSIKRQQVPSSAAQYWKDEIEKLSTSIADGLAINPELESLYRKENGNLVVDMALRKLAKRQAVEESLKENQEIDFGTLPEIIIEPEVVKESPIIATQNSPKPVITNNSNKAPKTSKVVKKENTTNSNINDLVKQTIQGKFGNGAARKAALGDNYAAVQALINKQLAGKRKTPKVNIPKIEQKYVIIESGHELPTEPIDIPQYFIDKHFELTNTPLTGAEIAAIRMDPFNLQTMPDEEIDTIIEETPEERKLARSERREQRKENRAQRKEARKQRRLSRRSKNNKTE